MLLALHGEDSPGSASGPCVDDDRHWFWYTLDRWPDADVTNGPRLTTPSAEAAYRTLVASQAGADLRRSCRLDVFVRNREVLGAVVAVSSGSTLLDDFARRLYPRPPTDLQGAEAFTVCVYGRSVKIESTFALELA
jgi:hypothetical protein